MWSFERFDEKIKKRIKETSKKQKIGAFIVGLTIILSAIGLIYWENDDGNKDKENKLRQEREENFSFGVCVAAHGLPGDWNEQVRQFVEKVDLPVPVEVGFLDYSPHQTIEDAIEKLNDAGVTRIIAIILFINGNTSHTQEIYDALAEAETNSDIFCTTAINNHTRMIETLTDHGLMLCEGSLTDPDDDWSGDPKDATLIYIGHGDNEENIQSWIALAEEMREEIENKTLFLEVSYCFMGDGNLRAAVQEANGYPLVVQWCVCYSEYSESEIRKEIVGEDCDYSKKAFIDHYNAVRWVEEQFYDYPNNLVWVDYNGNQTQASTFYA